MSNLSRTMPTRANRRKSSSTIPLLPAAEAARVLWDAAAVVVPAKHILGRRALSYVSAEGRMIALIADTVPEREHARLFALACTQRLTDKANDASPRNVIDVDFASRRRLA